MAKTQQKLRQKALLKTGKHLLRQLMRHLGLMKLLYGKQNSSKIKKKQKSKRRKKKRRMIRSKLLKLN